MNKGILLKLFFMAAALVVVVMILITAAKTDFNGAYGGDGHAENVFRAVFCGGRTGRLVCSFADVDGYGLSGDGVLFYHSPEKTFAGRYLRDNRRYYAAGGPGSTARAACRKERFYQCCCFGAVSKCGGDLNRMRSMVIESLQEQAMARLRRIEWMNIMGNVSPMVGLFGTVLGIIKMFNAMAAVGGQPHPSQLAGGISIALVTTLWGLMIAIPALTIHGVFQNRIEMLASESAEQAEKTLSQIAYTLREQRRTEQPKSGLGQPIAEIPPKSGGTIRTSTLSS